LIFGGEFVRDANGEAAGDSAIQDSFARLENRVRGLNPKLKAVRFTARWAIPAVFPHDLTPMIGPMPGVPRVLTAFGYSNHGAALPVWAGEQIAAAIMDERPLPKWASLSPRR
jgi:glycine/D-amino acid oxidase-like deaminating enzyme